MPVRFEPPENGKPRSFNPTLAVGNSLAQSVRRSLRHGGDGNRAQDTPAARISADIDRMGRTGETRDAMARRAAARIHRPNHVFSRVSNVNTAHKPVAARSRSAPEPAVAAPRPVQLGGRGGEGDEPAPSMYWWGFLCMILLPIILIIIIVCCCRTTAGPSMRVGGGGASTLTDYMSRT